MTLDLEELADVASNEIPDFIERLLSQLPGLKSHRCSPGYEGGFVERLHRGTYFAHIIEHIALELSTSAGIEVGYGKAIYGDAPGIYKVIVRYQSEEGMRFLLESAVELSTALVTGGTYDLDAKIEQAKRIVTDSALGPSTQAIVNAAERRGIPWTRLNELNLIQFGYGRHRQFIQATTTSATSDIAVDIAQDKDLTKRILQRCAIPVPRGVIVYNTVDVINAMAILSAPFAVKPVDGHHGNGVSLNLTTKEQLLEAFQIASENSSAVLMEEYFSGRDYRVVVVDGRMVAAAERLPASVLGDGTHTLRELIEIENLDPLRGDGHEKAMTKIKIDAVAKAYIRKTGLSLESVPAAGERVFLRETANLSTGGTAIDVTDVVHPEVREMCERAARIVGLDICGVDLILTDIAKPLSDQRGGIIELNAGPGIRMHHYPSAGTPRDVGAAIIEMMFPQGQNARIPIISITGTNGKTTVTRIVSHLFSGANKRVGMTTTDGIYIGGILIEKGDTTGPMSARAVLSDPTVDIAVLETARGGIIRRGLGYDWSDIGVITNIQADHIGQDGIRDVQDIVRIKSLVAERVREGGTVVLNADDDNVAKIAEHPNITKAPRNIVYFSLHSDHVILRRHINGGGTAWYLRDGYVCYWHEGSEHRIVRSSEMPFTFSGTARFQIANALAASAAAAAHGLDVNLTADGLRNFRPFEHNQGRANIYKLGRGYAIVDYGHNPDAFRAICEMTSQWHSRRVTGVIGVPGDRTDEMIRESARAAAQGFDRVIVRDDLDLRGRRPGETATLLCNAIREFDLGYPCEIEPDERAAMHLALRDTQDNDVVVLFYDDMDLVQSVLNTHQAVPINDLPEFELWPRAQAV